MDDIDAVTHGKFHISLPLWTIIDLSNGKPVLISTEHGTLLSLFTDVDLAKQFIQDRSPSPQAVSVEFKDHATIKQTALETKLHKCTHVGIDLSTRSPLKAAIQPIDFFIDSIPV